MTAIANQVAPKLIGVVVMWVGVVATLAIAG